MKKTLLSTALVLTMALNFEAQAAIGGVVALAGGGTTIALAGLGVSGVSMGLFTLNAYTLQSEEVGLATGDIGFFLGLVILDGENGQEIQFKRVPNERLMSMNLTEAEAKAYNDNTEELSAAFKMVSAELTTESTVEDAQKLWAEQELVLGKDSINAARKVLAQTIKN